MLTISRSFWLRASIGLASLCHALAGCTASSPDARLAVFDATWQTVRDNYFDKSFNGLDWEGVRITFREKAADARSSTELYWTVLNPMLALLESSHTYASAPKLSANALKVSDRQMAVIEPALARCIGLWMVQGRQGLRPRILAVADSGTAGSPLEPGQQIARYSTNAPELRSSGMSVIDKAGRERTITISSLLRRNTAADMAALQQSFRNLDAARLGLGPAGSLSLPYLGLTVAPGIAPSPFQVAMVEQGSAAAKAGVSPGSELIDVKDSQERDGSRSFVGKFRNSDSSVTSVRLRYNCSSVQDADAVRTSHLIGKDVLYLRFDRFSPGTSAWISAAIGKAPKSIILDLRRNTGGLISEMEPALEALTGRRFTVDRSVRAIDSKWRKSSGRKLRFSVLVGPVSASAAEVASDALRHFAGARLFGAVTAGEVQVSRQHRLPDGGTLQVAERSFTAADGSPIERLGVTPDQTVQETGASVRAGADRALDAAVLSLRGQLAQ